MTSVTHQLVGGSSCRGCGSKLAGRLTLDTVWETTKDALIFGGSCGAGSSELALGGGMGMHGAGLTGVQAVLELKGMTDKKLVALCGEGSTWEMAYETFSAAIARQQKITFVVMDNQAYAESGTHQSPTTSLGVRTPIHPAGKSWPQKNVALMTIFNGARYVATASPAFPADLRSKVAKAVLNPPSLVQMYCPCITSWGLDPAETITLGRLAVLNGLFPLWEYEDRVFSQTIKPKRRESVRAYVGLQRRYRGASEEEVEAVEQFAAELSSMMECMERGFCG